MIQEYGYEYDATLNKELWDKTKGITTDDKFEGALCLRSGRDALKAIAREYSSCQVFLPALACDSMVSPFRQYNHEVRFYSLNNDYSINLPSLEKNIGSGLCLFLYMDYFGCPVITNEKLIEIQTKYPRMIFIEDRTHNLIWERKRSFIPDYTIASLRKWIAIPDGGLLWGRITKPLSADVLFTETRLKAQMLRHQYFISGNEEIKENYRRIFSTVSDIMDADEPSKMSAYSYALAAEADWDRIRFQRKKNAEILSNILEPYVTLIQKEAELSSLYVPFLVQHRDTIQRNLSAKGIFNTVIWPLSDEQTQKCRVASHTMASMLAAPCDQRYTIDDMKYIGHEIIKEITKNNG